MPRASWNTRRRLSAVFDTLRPALSFAATCMSNRGAGNEGGDTHPKPAPRPSVTAPRDDRWSHLAVAAFSLDEQQTTAREVLDSALEVFPPGLEPDEDFPGYAVRRLLLALRRALDGST